jgi:hypothetical protein
MSSKIRPGRSDVSRGSRSAPRITLPAAALEQAGRDRHHPSDHEGGSVPRRIGFSVSAARTGTIGGRVRGAVRRSKNATLRARISAALSAVDMLHLLPEAEAKVEVGGAGSKKGRSGGARLIGKMKVVQANQTDYGGLDERIGSVRDHDGVLHRKRIFARRVNADGFTEPMLDEEELYFVIGARIEHRFDGGDGILHWALHGHIPHFRGSADHSKGLKETTNGGPYPGFRQNRTTAHSSRP